MSRAYGLEYQKISGLGTLLTIQAIDSGILESRTHLTRVRDGKAFIIKEAGFDDGSGRRQQSLSPGARGYIYIYHAKPSEFQAGDIYIY